MTRCSRPLTAIVLTLGLAACAPGPARPPQRAPVVGSSPATPSASETRLAEADERFKAALQLMKDGQRPAAQAAFIALSREYPDLSGPLTDLGILYAQGQQRALAIASLSRAVAANPRNAVAHNWLGTLYREAGDYAAAERAFRQALSVRPDYAEAHLNLGVLYDLSMRRPRDALTQYREYQRYAGTDRLIVSAWIKELEATTGTETASTLGEGR